MAITQQTAQRVVHFFNIGFGFKDDRTPNESFRKLFNNITYMSDSKDERRYQPIGGKLLFVQNVRFIEGDKMIRGQIRAVRTDEVPELLNMETDTTREIARAEKEGIVETTHFLISYRNNMKRIAVEYHTAGAKAHELKTYLLAVGEVVGLQSIYMERIVNKNVLDELERRMGRVSHIHVTVPRDNISQVQKLDGQMASLLRDAKDYTDSDSITLDFKFDYRKRPQTEKANDIVHTYVENIKKNELATDAFEAFTVKVEDTEHNNLLQVFDLLADKAKTHIRVNKKPKGAGLDSEHVYQELAKEMRRLKYL